MNNQDGEGAQVRKIIPGIVVIFTLSLIFLQGERECRRLNNIYYGGKEYRDPGLNFRNDKKGIHGEEKERLPRSTYPFPLDSYNLSLCDDHNCEEDGNERKVYQ